MKTLLEATWQAARTGRWAALILGTLVTLLFVAFVVGEGPPPVWSFNLQQNVQFFGMCTLCLGFALAWKWEGLGGALALLSYGVLLLNDRRFVGTWKFGVPAIIGAAHLLCWWRLAAGRGK